MFGNSECNREFIRRRAAERSALHAAGARSPESSQRLADDYSATGDFLVRACGPEAEASLVAGDTLSWDYAVCFLEVHPFCPGSGFAVRDLVKILMRAEIPEIFESRLREALLRIACEPPRDEMKHLRRLIVRIADEDFVSRLDAAATSCESARDLAARVVRHWRSRP